MAAAPQPRHRYAPEGDFEFERRPEESFKFRNGELFSMSIVGAEQGPVESNLI